ncbi:hypothetical protein ACOSP7_016302 [Xanthoceras sorbifolium]
MKGERIAKRSTFGSIMRRRLSDITNSPSQPKLLNLTHQEKPSQVPPSTEDVINQLIKEKMTLMKLIEEKNKIIELSGNELQNLRTNFQKLQLQNWNLAQSNSQFLAELNLGREKMKALQHEIVCKDALLKAIKMEKEGKLDMNCENTGSQVSKGNKDTNCENIGSQGSKEGEKVAAECLPNVDNNDKPCTSNRRRSTRSKSTGPSTIHRQATEKDKVENKRRCLRRQSARFHSQEREPAENLFEIEDTKLPTTTLPVDDLMQEDVSTPAGSSIANEKTCSSINETQVSQRSSMGRPLRRAAEKGKMEMNCANTGSQVSKEGEKVAAECLPNVDNNDKPCTSNRRRSTRSKSTGPSTAHRQSAEKDKVETKRHCLRRQSARFHSQEREPAENLFEVEDTKLPATTLPGDDPMHEDVSTPAGSSIANETQVSQRSSMGRPLRRASEKVQSYREAPLNVKMRR